MRRQPFRRERPGLPPRRRAVTAARPAHHARRLPSPPLVRGGEPVDRALPYLEPPEVSEEGPVPSFLWPVREPVVSKRPRPARLLVVQHGWPTAVVVPGRPVADRVV